MLLLFTLVFLTIAFAVFGLFLYVTPTRTQERLQTIAGPAEETPWTETIVKIAGPLARLSTPSGDWESSPLRIRFLNAGIRHENARLLYFGAKTVVPLFLASIVFVVARALNMTDWVSIVLVVMVAALAGCYLPNLLLMIKKSERQREIFDSFPDAADLMLVCVEAGLGLDSALTKVADEMKRKSVALAEELHLTNLEVRAGASREKSLRNLALRTGVEEITTFATMLTQAEKFGTSIADALRVFSDELRHKRQVRAEERAAKIPTKLLFPLVMCIFPSIFMVILGPAIIQIIRTVAPLFANGG